MLLAMSSAPKLEPHFTSLVEQLTSIASKTRIGLNTYSDSLIFSEFSVTLEKSISLNLFGTRVQTNNPIVIRIPSKAQITSNQLSTVLNILSSFNSYYRLVFHLQNHTASTTLNSWQLSIPFVCFGKLNISWI